MERIISQEEALSIIDSFAKIKVGIIGDVMLDKYIFGKVRRISPEAPVPVVEVTKEKVSCGGAANVCSNISSLGGGVNIVSIVGGDRAGRILLDLLSSMKSVSTDFVIEIKSHITTQKTRIIAEHQQVVRVDREEKLNLSSSVKDKLKENIKKVIENSDVIILSDYGKGVLSREIIEFSIDFAKRKRVAIFVDPKIEHFMAYRGVTSMTPNVHEAFGGMRRIENFDEKAIENLGQEIIKKLSLPTLIITRSEHGMSVFEKKSSTIQITHIPTTAKEVFDVTGAGDTVISVVSLSYAVCRNILKSAAIANYAAGIVVSKIGSASVSPLELKETIK